MKKITDEVFYTESNLLSLKSSNLTFISEGALASSLSRCRLCAHISEKDTLQEMFIALKRGAYIQPHRHHLKSESIHVISGEADLVIFDDNGEIEDVIKLGDYSSEKSFFFRIGDPIFHSLIIRSNVFLFHETTTGPFRKADTEYADWSPREQEPESQDYLLKLEEEIVKRF